MKTKITPKLILNDDVLVSYSGKYFWWFHMNTFKKCIEFPRAKAYWLEIADCQWPDKSGTPIQIRVGGNGWSRLVGWSTGGKYCYDICLPADNAIEKFVGPKTKATVYFRLLYEE